MANEKWATPVLMTESMTAGPLNHSMKFFIYRDAMAPDADTL